MIAMMIIISMRRRRMMTTRTTMMMMIMMMIENRTSHRMGHSRTLRVVSLRTAGGGSPTGSAVRWRW
jgi:hypothetical protein